MAAITDYMFDTSFVQEVIDYLHTEYSISTRVLDSGEHAVIPKESQAEPLPVTKFFPFDFQENIGGLECSANDETALAQAESHILFCLKGINNLLLRELELQQTSDEMLQLSSQLNFLF
ncbi:MAG: HD-GYP domain-containing protein, partial [Desulfobulbaceae bacterium]|nr:HD-GYP domain-containing protein [Desulfobulbaceae bacterium]